MVGEFHATNASCQRFSIVDNEPSSFGKCRPHLQLGNQQLKIINPTTWARRRISLIFILLAFVCKDNKVKQKI